VNEAHGRPDRAIERVPERAPESGTHTIVVGADHAGERLDLCLARALDTSRTHAATLVAGGQVTVDGRREKASWRVRAGERIVADVPPSPGREVVPEDIPIPVVHEDDEIVVVDKPAGMVVHPAPGNWTGTLVNALVGRGQGLAPGGGDERPGLVHRIDKDTSGLLVVAKTDRAHRLLSAAVAARQVTRRYAAACWGHLADDRLTVERAIARDPRDRKRMAVVPAGAGGGKPARTDFVRLARYDAGDLLRAHLHSGRTHQIRVHLASIGHPVMGDDTYGGGGGRRLVALPTPRHFLHAALLRFRHPASGAEVEFRAPLPPDLRRSLAALAEDPALADEPDPLARLGFFADG
jgi:23S rRNA pseudouridine1911/1915/1917 synthase